MKKYALLSLFDKTGSAGVARRLMDLGYSILSSGGTAAHLRGLNIPVTDVAEVTGYPPVLGHRVVTLAPQIHGGLLANLAMEAELQELDWPRIGFLYVTFYPLEAELGRDVSTFESCLEKTDIGGPAMVRSANKGGEVIVLADPEEGLVDLVLQWMENNMPEKENSMRYLRYLAEDQVADYTRKSADVHFKYAPDRPDHLVPVDERR